MREKIFVADLAGLIVNIGREIHVEKEEIALFRLPDDSVRAVGNRCPHENGPLAEGIVAGEFVFLPVA